MPRKPRSWSSSVAPDLLARIKRQGTVPRHIAIIMDGNGRWARERHLPRPLGHRAGMKAVREGVEGAIAAGGGGRTPCALPGGQRQGRPAETVGRMALTQ